MFCTNCGAALAADSSFCTACGHRVMTLVAETAREVAPPPLNFAARPPAEKLSASNYCWSLLGLIGGIIGWNLIHRRDARMARVILVLGIVWSLLLTGLSFSLVQWGSTAVVGVVQRQITHTNTYSTTPATTTPAVVSSGTTTLNAATAAHVWTVYLTSSSGQALTTSLEIGSPEAYQSGLTNGSAVAGTSCSLTPGTDEVIPANVVMNNVTPGQVSTLGADFSGIGGQSIPALMGPSLLWEASYSTGSSCDGQNDGRTDFGIYSDNQEPEGTTNTTNGFLEITNFSSPNYSALQVLQDAVITVPSSFSVNPTGGQGNSVATDFTVTAVQGPGVVQTSSGWEFTLAGTTPS